MILNTLKVLQLRLKESVPCEMFCRLLVLFFFSDVLTCTIKSLALLAWCTMFETLLREDFGVGMYFKNRNSLKESPWCSWKVSVLGCEMPLSRQRMVL